MFGIFGYLLAGLGLFFVGNYLVDRHLKQLTGPRLRGIFIQLTGTGTKAAWWGFCIGALTQTASAITFICISMVNSGLLPLRRAITVLNWSNPGTCLLIFFLTLPLDLFAAYTVGLAGLLYAFQIPRRGRAVTGFVFGMALLFFGLFLMERQGGELQYYEWFREMIAQATSSYLATFVVAVLLTMVAQSGNAVVLVILVLTSAGLLDARHGIMAVYGANLGASLITQILTLRLKGTPKKMAMFQVYFGWVGTVIMVPLFYFELWTGLPLVMALLDSLPCTQATEIAVVNLLWCLVTTLALAPLEGRFAHWLARIYPPQEDEDARRPRYLYPHCDEHAETCLELIAKEQKRLARRLVRYLESDARASEFGDRVFHLHEDNRALANEINHYLYLLVDRDLRGDTARKLRSMLERMEILLSLDAEFHRTIPPARKKLKGQDSLAHRLMEGFEAAMRTVLDGLESGDEIDLRLAHTITEDGSETLSKMRESFIRSASEYSSAEQAELMRLVAGIERLIWLLNSLTRNLEASR